VLRETETQRKVWGISRSLDSEKILGAALADLAYPGFAVITRYGKRRELERVLDSAVRIHSRTRARGLQVAELMECSEQSSLGSCLRTRGQVDGPGTTRLMRSGARCSPDRLRPSPIGHSSAGAPGSGQRLLGPCGAERVGQHLVRAHGWRLAPAGAKLRPTDGPVIPSHPSRPAGARADCS
jgi:hypothetical protein